MASKIKTQVRFGFSHAHWLDMGSMGWIEAVEKFALQHRVDDGMLIHVRDANDPSRPIASFTVKKVVSYVVENPRQGAL